MVSQVKFQVYHQGAWRDSYTDTHATDGWSYSWNSNTAGVLVDTDVYIRARSLDGCCPVNGGCLGCWSAWYQEGPFTIDNSVPVGGMAELPDVPESSAPNYIALAGLAAAAVIVLTAGAWYARRRWSR